MTTPTHSSDTEEDKIFQCGFCGRYFRGGKFLSPYNMSEFSAHFIQSINLGYCPDAPGEDPDSDVRYVTKDMATDAGMPEIEGQRL